MASTPIQLPRDPKKLALVVRRHAEREHHRTLYRRLMWSLAWYYMQGYRNFGVLDGKNGTVIPQMVERDKVADYQSSLLLFMTNQIASHVASMDLRPIVTRRGTSLNSIRSRSAAMAILNPMIRKEEIEQKATTFSYLLTALGCAGIAGMVEEHPAGGLTVDLEVIHPQELFPFPSLGQDHTKQQGLLRQRMVSLNWLKSKFSRLDPEKIEWWEVDPGEEWADMVNNSSSMDLGLGAFNVVDGTSSPGSPGGTGFPKKSSDKGA
ncbi:MAG: hypothetical protein D6812_01100, partial [Deltaproteobacteria bacterium]